MKDENNKYEDFKRLVLDLFDGNFLIEEDKTQKDAFIKTDKVDYDVHVAKNKYTKVETVDFYIKGIPIMHVKTMVIILIADSFIRSFN